jgi:uncharacterized protein (TIGR01777 family)
VRILVTGASGLVGSALVPLLSREHEVFTLGRGAPRTARDLRWDPEAGSLDPRPLEGCDAVVHLAGESIGGRRWNAAHKARIRESRVRGTRLLSESLAALERPPRVLITSSGVGYYGDRGEEALGEESGPGTGFLAGVAVEWEEATSAAAARGIRVIRMRLGLVLAGRGGALEPMRRVFALGLGGPFGSGRQWMSWIALDDLTAVVAHGIARDDLGGAVNAVAPGAVTGREFARVLGRVMKRPALLRAPAFALRLVLGREMADELLLASQRAEPRRLLATGFAFRFPALEPALRHVLGAGHS